MPKRLLHGAVAALLGAAASVAVGLPARTAVAASTCTVTYTIVNQWNTGFQANVNITNNAAPINGWTLSFQFPETQVVTNGWAGSWTQSGPQVTVTNLSWDGSLGTGGSAGLGLVGSWSGANDVPTYFTLNGLACNGAPQRPTVSLTAPPAGGVYDAPASIMLNARAASTNGGTIAGVQFLDNGTPLGTVTVAPYQFTAANLAAGAHKFVARATDSSNSATADSVAVGVFVRKGPAPALHVSGNKLVNAAGAAVVLWGVNRSGGEYACVQGNGFFDGPMDASAVLAIASWRNVNAVRVPLNEDCWLGHSNVQPQFAGANYQAAVGNYVGLLHSFGLVAILDLHWTDGNYNGSHDAFCSGNANAVCQKPMPDIGAVAFWQGVATTFKNDPATVFDLFNEPFPDRAFNFATAPAWACWRDGGTTACPATAGFQYTVAGMQSLVTAVRGTGALNVIMLGGIAYSNDETQWLQFRPADPTGNLAASWHSYNFNFCNNRPPNPTNCWQTQIAPLATSVPVIAGEIGEDDCAHAYIDGLMTFLDGQGSGYLGWAWNADFDCARGPGLISAYDGTPTAFGIGLRSHLAGLP